MDLLIGGQKGLGQSNSNLIRSRVVMFADLPGFKVSKLRLFLFLVVCPDDRAVFFCHMETSYASCLQQRAAVRSY